MIGFYHIKLAAFYDYDNDGNGGISYGLGQSLNIPEREVKEFLEQANIEHDYNMLGTYLRVFNTEDLLLFKLRFGLD